MKNLSKIVPVLVVLAIGSIYGMAGITNVELGETGIKTVMLGGERGGTSPIFTGTRWIDPVSNDVDIYVTKFKQYDLAGADAVESQTNDGQPVNLRVSFQIGLIPAQVPWLHENVGQNWYYDVFYPAAIKAIKDSSAMLSSDDIYTGEGRTKMATNIQSTLESKLEGYGIRFETNLRDVTFQNKAFIEVLEEKAAAAQREEIERRNALAAVQRAKATQNTAEGEKFRIEQESMAERRRLQLQGEGQRLQQEEIALGILAVGNAEAEVIKLKANALVGSGGKLYRDIEVLGGLGKTVEFYGVPTGAPGTNTYIVDQALKGKIAVGD